LWPHTFVEIRHAPVYLLETSKQLGKIFWR
jgi:hypothetical protein